MEVSDLLCAYNCQQTTKSEIVDRNWNEEFQVLMDMPPCEEKYEKLGHLSQDFVHQAQVFGQIIISEVFL